MASVCSSVKNNMSIKNSISMAQRLINNIKRPEILENYMNPLLPDGNMYSWQYQLATRRHVKTLNVQDIHIDAVLSLIPQLANFSQIIVANWSKNNKVNSNNNCSHSLVENLHSNLPKIIFEINDLIKMCKQRQLDEIIIPKSELLKALKAMDIELKMQVFNSNFPLSWVMRILSTI
jgi:hypothetical protein